MKKKHSSILLVILAMIFTLMPMSSFAIDREDMDEDYVELRKYLYDDGKDSTKLGSEWTIIGLTRGGIKLPNDFFTDYYGNVMDYVEKNIDKNERLDKKDSTKNSKMILAMTTIGINAENVEGHNLIQGISDLDYVKDGGIDDVAWAMMAVSCHDYKIPDPITEGEKFDLDIAADYLLNKQLDDGGWAEKGDKADPELTAIVVQALSKKYNEGDKNIVAAVDKAINKLSDMQEDSGHFKKDGKEDSEVASQVIIALTSTGSDPINDDRFIKDKKDLFDVLFDFGGDKEGIKKTLDGKVNKDASQIALVALASYYRLADGNDPVYEMVEVELMGEDVDASEKKKADTRVESLRTVFKYIALGVPAAAILFLIVRKIQRMLMGL